MKLLLSSLLLMTVVIISCQTNRQPTDVIYNEAAIPVNEYTIDITKDTTLVTPNGALLKILQGTFATETGQSVTLEIKEAFLMEQMIRAGLLTRTNGEPLSSGGMIYINAKAGQQVTIKKAISVAIPASHLEKDMQVFKGEKDENGNINWKDPKPLPSTEQITSLQSGKILFEQKCASCHSIGKDMKGPDLAHFPTRFIAGEQNWRYYEHGIMEDAFDVDAYHPESYQPNIYKCNLSKRFPGDAPRMLKDTSDELSIVYRYIQNESDRLRLPLPPQQLLFEGADSCSKYITAKMELEQKKDRLTDKKQSLITDNGSLVEMHNTPATPPANGPALRPVNFDDRVSPKNIDAVYYQFTIESFGWYNIDILLKGINGVEESELFVRIQGEYQTKVKVFLIIPSVKVYIEGGPAARDEDEFAFYKKNGTIPLPQNTKAYILALTETEQSIAFALQEFTTSTRQELLINLNSATKEVFEKAISNAGFDNLKISFGETRNATQIRSIDTSLNKLKQQLKSIENLRPKNVDCQCQNNWHPTVTAPEKQ